MVTDLISRKCIDDIYVLILKRLKDRNTLTCGR